MLLKETLLSVLEPLAPAPRRDDVVRLFRPEWVPSTETHALVLTGVRRCGKSTLQGQVRRGIRGPSVFLNLEDTRLYGMSPGDFPTLISILEERHPHASVYLDEVQEVPEWQRLVRALLDRGHPVCVTGSNASLLGREMGSKLTGRHISHAVYPFSFRECLKFTKSQANAATLRDYLQRGGFPSALRAGPEQGAVLLRELMRDLVQRDIVSRHGLRAVRPLMTLALHLISHPGQPLSLQTLSKSLSLPSVAQTAKWVEYLQDAWILLSLPKFSAKFKQRVVAPPKYYAIDPGFAAANSPNATPDLGRRLENAVFLRLLRSGASPTYAASPHEWECDFVTPHQAIQCCLHLTPENRSREIRGLIEAAELPGAAPKKSRELLVLTLDQKDSLVEKGRRIRVIPAWSWLD